LARTTALENVELPLLYRREKPSRNIREIAKEMLERVGLGGRLHHLPSQLSGGQQQRVALARALVNNPSLILADEPTGNLDTEMSLEVMAIFQDLHEAGITIVMVTHEPDIAQFTRRKVQFRDGKVLQDQPIPNPPRADEVLQQWKKEHAL